MVGLRFTLDAPDATVEVVPASDAGFEVWATEVLPLLVRMGQRGLRTSQDAEDIACEVLARAYARWPSLSRRGNPRPWALRVAANLIIDAARKTKTARDYVPPTVLPRSCNVELELVVLAALRTLPRGQRQALVLRYFADQPVADVAAVMGVSLNTAKKHLSRGLSSLRLDNNLQGALND